MIGLDPELGPVRWCARCEEWLPDDEEFFWLERRPAGRLYTDRRGRRRPYTRDVIVHHCRCCSAERARLYRERVRQAS